MMKNMLNKKWKVCVFIVFIIGLVIFFTVRKKQKGALHQTIEIEVSPQRGNIQLTVSTQGSVRPQNRLELKPSISGRIEEILVEEGDEVKKGDILAWMSSSERAAILDAALAQDKKTLEYWQKVYRPAPLIAPIDGVVIGREVEPGQTVNTSEAALVLSDRLIVEALADESDIGKIKIGNPVVVRLDAYPLEEIEGVVDHISYESTIESFVTMYEIEILPKEVPEFFRAGMSAEVDITIESKKDILHIPLDAMKEEDGQAYVYVKKAAKGRPVKKKVELGIADEEKIEVISGLDSKDKVIIKTQRFKLPKEYTGKSPFFPDYRKKEKDKDKK